MSHESLQSKTINSFEDIRTVIIHLPEGRETLMTLTQEVKVLIQSKGSKPELKIYLMGLIGDVSEADKKSLNAEQKYFLEQTQEMLEEYIDMLNEQ